MIQPLDFNGLFSQSKTNFGYTRIRTPFTYLDGTVIDLFYKVNKDGTVLLSDLGETLRWMSSINTNPVHTLSEAFGVELNQTSYQVETTLDNMENAVISFSQTLIRISS